MNGLTQREGKERKKRIGTTDVTVKHKSPKNPKKY